MKNLELKVKIPEQDRNIIHEIIKDHYKEQLIQKDTYYNVDNGSKIKLREETNKIPYIIYYNRPICSSEKISEYYTHYIDNITTFNQTIGKVLKMEIIVEKIRDLYLYENARIHLDNVTNLGSYLEIEVVINNEIENEKSGFLMKFIIELLNLDKYEKIACGYRELLLQKNSENKNLAYYALQNKVYWVVNEDLNDKIKRNDKVPCIYVEKKDNKYKILQFDETIKLDSLKYTAFRKLLGITYNIYVDVLLICDDKLYTLQNEIIDFADLERSNVVVDKKYLSPFC
jgi:adenylate cyclase class 2